MSECGHWYMILLSVLSIIAGYALGWKQRGEDED